MNYSKTHKTRKARVTTGYLIFINENRYNAEKLLREIEAERTFINKDGDTITVNPNDFYNERPQYAHVTQKLASMWHYLNKEQRSKYHQIANNINDLNK